MKIDITKSLLPNKRVDAIVIPVWEQQSINAGPLQHLNKATQSWISQIWKSGAVQPKLYKSIVIANNTAVKSNWIILVGLGNKNKVTANHFRHLAGHVARDLKNIKAKTVFFALPNAQFPQLQPETLSQSILEGLVMGGYEFNEFKSKPEKGVILESLTLALEKYAKLNDFRKGIEKGTVLGKAVNVSRDLSNMPANHLTPTRFIEYIKKEVPKTVKLEIIDAKKAESLNMGGFLGVAKGSIEAPYMAVLRYTPEKGKQPIALVGKGVCFDSGGISIKPSAKMSEMKGDMSGAACVFAAFMAAVELGVKTNITAVLPLVENMPSGSALKPGDVITMSNGKTVEILNTDAEGRLILADALCLAVKENPKAIVDVATLTGACLIALGDQAMGLFTNKPGLSATFKQISQETGERVWELPLFPEYLEQMQSDTADMINAFEGRLAGASTAAIFLEQFIDKTPWVHLDIAPTMVYSKPKGFQVKGFSGLSTRNLFEFVSRNAS